MPWQKIIRFGMLLSARIAGAGSLFAVNLLIVHYLGLDALATYAVFVSLVSITAVFLSSGFTAIAPMFVAEYSKKKQPGLLKGFANTALNRGAMLLAVFTLGLILVFFSGNQVSFINNLELAVAALLTATATAALGFNGAVLVGMKKQVAALVPDTFIRPTVFLVFSCLFLVSGLATSISAILWLLAFSVWLTLGVVLVRDRNLRKNFSEIPKEKDKVRWRNASLPWMGITLVWDFMIDLMLLFFSIFAGSVEIAILHICFRYRVLAGFGMRTIHTLLMPEITEQKVSGNFEGLKRKLFQLNLTSLVYSFGVCAAFAVFGNLLLGMFSSEAVGAVPILLIISATMVIRAIFGPAPLILAIHNFHMVTLVVSFISMIGALIFIWATYSYLGIMAVAFGYTAANLFISVALWILARKKTGIDCSLFSGGPLTVKSDNKLKSISA